MLFHFKAHAADGKAGTKNSRKDTEIADGKAGMKNSRKDTETADGEAGMNNSRKDTGAVLSVAELRESVLKDKPYIRFDNMKEFFGGLLYDTELYIFKDNDGFYIFVCDNEEKASDGAGGFTKKIPDRFVHCTDAYSSSYDWLDDFLKWVTQFSWEVVGIFRVVRSCINKIKQTVMQFFEENGGASAPENACPDEVKPDRFRLISELGMTESKSTDSCSVKTFDELIEKIRHEDGVRRREGILEIGSFEERICDIDPEPGWHIQWVGFTFPDKKPFVKRARQIVRHFAFDSEEEKVDISWDQARRLTCKDINADNCMEYISENTLERIMASHYRKPCLIREAALTECEADITYYCVREDRRFGGSMVLFRKCSDGYHIFAADDLFGRADDIQEPYTEEKIDRLFMDNVKSSYQNYYDRRLTELELRVFKAGYLLSRKEGDKPWVELCGDMGHKTEIVIGGKKQSYDRFLEADELMINFMFRIAERGVVPNPTQAAE